MNAWKKVKKDASPNTYPVGYIHAGTIPSRVLQNMVVPRALKSLWLRGPGGIGKTTWALNISSKPALFVRHLDTLAEFRCGYHKSVIFDDLKFLHMPRTQQIMLADREAPQQIHLRYIKVDLPQGIEKIFLSNDEIFDLRDEPIMRRIIYIQLNCEIVNLPEEIIETQ